MTLAERLYPEAEAQLKATRRVLANVPDGHNDFAAHPKSMPLTRLAGHTAELAGFAHHILTLPGINMGTPEDPRKILRMSTIEALLAEYDGMAETALATLKATLDAAFDETFTLSRQGTILRTFPSLRGLPLDVPRPHDPSSCATRRLPPPARPARPPNLWADCRREIEATASAPSSRAATTSWGGSFAC